MLCDPAGSGAVCRAACPEPSRGADPNVAVPSVNVTVPVGPGVGVTVAVRVTAWPAVEGFCDDDTVTAVGVPRAEMHPGTARHTLSLPPVCTLPESDANASVLSSMVALSAGADMALLDSAKAAAPATMGAAAEVPSKHHSV